MGWNEFGGKKKNKYPTDDESSVKEFIEAKKLPKDFYPYYPVKYNLFQILKKSSYYKLIQQKFDEYTKKQKVLSQIKIIIIL